MAEPDGETGRQAESDQLDHSSEPAAIQPSAVEVSVSVSNISRQGLDLLEKLLSQWAEWHHQAHQQEYPAELQLLRGSLALDVRQLYQDGCVGWIDKISHVPGTGKPISQACTYELREAPPLYDRASDELLAPPAGLAGNRVAAAPGGAAAARRRQMAEACVGDGAGDGTPAAKRRRLPNMRCFNCGSYAHGIAQCPRPMDQDRVAAARRDTGGGGGGAMAAMLRQRYFGSSGGKGAGSPYEGITPGNISTELAQALGMRSQLAPPPWISRMKVMGIPPKYCARAPGEPQEGFMTFIMGSEEEEDEQGEEEEEQQEEEQAGTSSGAQGEAADAAADGSNGSGPAAAAGSEGYPDADFPPIGGAAKQPAGADQDQEGGTQQQQQQQLEGQQQQGGVQQDSTAGRFDMAAAAAAAAAGGESRGGTEQALQQFPGINAPLPEGADASAWNAELEKAYFIMRAIDLQCTPTTYGQL